MTKDLIDYEAWALELCVLLDAIERELGDGQGDINESYHLNAALELTKGRFEIAKKHGLDVILGEPASGSLQ